MSGHSKWSNIKNKKAANDSARASVFTKMAKAITVAARTGRGVEEAVVRARAVSMPKENIDRAIEKGLGRGGDELVELTIEGFGPAGVAFVATVITDSRNRSVAELRTLIEKHGGHMGEPGSVIYLFDKVDGRYVAKYPVVPSETQSVGTFLQILSDYADVQEVYANLG